MLAFLKRLGATFPAPRKLVVAGSSAGGFGALANYPAFRWYWPDAVSYLVDDSGPPLAGAAIPASTRAAWYASWDMGASLDAFCPSCQADFSQGLRALAARYPQDRIALLSHLQDLTIREFFGTYTLSPPSFNAMPATDFEAALRALGTDAMDPHGEREVLLHRRQWASDPPRPDGDWHAHAARGLDRAHALRRAELGERGGLSERPRTLPSPASTRGRRSACVPLPPQAG